MVEEVGGGKLCRWAKVAGAFTGRGWGGVGASRLQADVVGCLLAFMLHAEGMPAVQPLRTNMRLVKVAQANRAL